MFAEEKNVVATSTPDSERGRVSDGVRALFMTQEGL
jgi:hypothetical protein